MTDHLSCVFKDRKFLAQGRIHVSVNEPLSKDHLS